MTESHLPPDAPAGYPADLERWIRVAGGRRVFVRPVVGGDAPVLERELARADLETVYQRFFRAPVKLGSAQIERLTHLDYQTRLALAAFTPDGEGLGIARYETTEPGVAEIAVVVRRDARKLGIASRLLELLEEAAAARGIGRLTALYLPGNEAIAGVLAGRGFTVGVPEAGVASAEKRVTAA